MTGTIGSVPDSPFASALKQIHGSLLGWFLVPLAVILSSPHGTGGMHCYQGSWILQKDVTSPWLYFLLSLRGPYSTGEQRTASLEIAGQYRTVPSSLLLFPSIVQLQETQTSEGYMKDRRPHLSSWCFIIHYKDILWFIYPVYVVKHLIILIFLLR